MSSFIFSKSALCNQQTVSWSINIMHVSLSNGDLAKLIHIYTPLMFYLVIPYMDLVLIPSLSYS